VSFIDVLVLLLSLPLEIDARSGGIDARGRTETIVARFE